MNQREERTHATLFAPCTEGSHQVRARNLQAAGFELSGDELIADGVRFSARVKWVDNPTDGSFGGAFSFGTTTKTEQQAIEAAPGAFLIDLPVDLHRDRAGAVRLVRGLSAAGALAVRVEESGLGFMLERWLSLVDGDDPWSLYRAVAIMLKDGPHAVTRGMRVFSLPDAQVAIDKSTSEANANALLGVLNVYQIAEDPLLLSGHTFSADAESPKRALYRWPDAVYPRDHVCHNPFGVWRLGAAGSTGEPSNALAITFVPSLVALLESLEQKQGEPLTQEQVEETTSNAVCMTMEHRDAREFERSRGYADIDPRRAWEQWQLARSVF
jgi:hypothetical protein